jgi:hypothetical protein
MRAMLCRCVRVIEHALSAQREYMTKEGQIVAGGPDHYVRLAAKKHFHDFITLGGPGPEQPEQQRRTIRCEELKQLAESAMSGRNADMVA